MSIADLERRTGFKLNILVLATMGKIYSNFNPKSPIKGLFHGEPAQSLGIDGKTYVVSVGKSRQTGRPAGISLMIKHGQPGHAPAFQEQYWFPWSDLDGMDVVFPNAEAQ